MKVGYAYCSEIEDTLKQQIKRLQESGCERIYQETLTGVHADRPKLKKCLDNLRAGDTFIVCRLDCIGTKIEKVLLLLYELVGMGVTFISSAIADNCFNATRSYVGSFPSLKIPIFSSFFIMSFSNRPRFSTCSIFGAFFIFVSSAVICPLSFVRSTRERHISSSSYPASFKIFCRSSSGITRSKRMELATIQFDRLDS